MLRRSEALARRKPTHVAAIPGVRHPLEYPTATMLLTVLASAYAVGWLTGQIEMVPAFWSQTSTRSPEGDQSSIIGCAG
jgi:hypothetical protein